VSGSARECWPEAPSTPAFVPTISDNQIDQPLTPPTDVRPTFKHPARAHRNAGFIDIV
jgi:hypothetical protein